MPGKSVNRKNLTFLFPVDCGPSLCSHFTRAAAEAEMCRVAVRSGANPKAPSATHTHTCGCFYKSLLIRGSYSGSVLTAYPCNDGVEERSNFGMTMA